MTMMKTCNKNGHKCQLRPVEGQTRMVTRKIRQGMASNEKFKFVKVHKMVCFGCGRGTWKECR